MKSPKFLALALVLAGISSATATTITFEDAGSTVGTDLGNFYPGITFGADVQVVNGLLPFYPPHSGIYEIQNANIFNPIMSIVFATPQTSLSFWYTSFVSIDISTYDSLGHVIQTTVTPSGNTGTNALFSISSPGIKSFSLTTDLSTQYPYGESITLDDISFSTNAPAVPETASTLGLLGLAAVGLVAFRKQVVA